MWSNLKWNNKSAITWSLEIINKELWAKDDCPYGASKIQVNYNLDSIKPQAYPPH